MRFHESRGLGFLASIPPCVASWTLRFLSRVDTDSHTSPFDPSRDLVSLVRLQVTEQGSVGYNGGLGGIRTPPQVETSPVKPPFFHFTSKKNTIEYQVGLRIRL
jgi:hypothetical protein